MVVAAVVVPDVGELLFELTTGILDDHPDTRIHDVAGGKRRLSWRRRRRTNEGTNQRMTIRSEHRYVFKAEVVEEKNGSGRSAFWSFDDDDDVKPT